MTPEEELADLGWTKVPAVFELNQRWSDGTEMGWFECPRDLPMGLVLGLAKNARIMLDDAQSQ